MPTNVDNDFEDSKNNLVLNYISDVENKHYSTLLLDTDPDFKILNGFISLDLIITFEQLENYMVHQVITKEVKDWNGTMIEIPIHSNSDIVKFREMLIVQLFSQICCERIIESDDFTRFDLFKSNSGFEDFHKVIELADPDFEQVCISIWRIYELAISHGDYNDYESADAILKSIISLNSTKLMQYFIALEIDSMVWFLFCKYCRHLNIDPDVKNCTFLQRIMMYNRTKENMFQVLVEEYEQKVFDHHYNNNINNSNNNHITSIVSSKYVQLAFPIDVITYKNKMLHEIKYCLIVSMMYCFRELLLDINSFFYDELDHYYGIHHNLMVDSKTRIYELISEEMKNFQYKGFDHQHYDPEKDLEVANLTYKFFRKLDYENTCLVWVNVASIRAENNEWKWNYYYLLYYLEEMKIVNNNNVFLNKRFSQIIRENKIKPSPLVAGNLNIDNVLTIPDIHYFYQRDAEKLPLSITYNKILRIGFTGDDIGYETVLDSKLIVSNHNNHLKYNSSNVYDIVNPYNYIIEEANIEDCLCFDPNSITLMSLVVCLIIDPTIIIVIPIDKRCYRELMFNKLTNVTFIQLMRLQQLSIENMLNKRNTSLLNRIHLMIGYIRRTRRHLSSPMSILIELDKNITDHYHVLRDNIIIGENSNESLYYINKEIRLLNAQSLLYSKLEEDISPDKNNLNIKLHSELIYDYNQSLIYNVLQYLMTYGFNRVIRFIYRHNMLECETNSLNHQGNCNDNMTLYCIKISENKEIINIVHHDEIYKTEYNYHFNPNFFETHKIRLFRWKTSITHLVMRHLHSTDTIFNLHDLLLANNDNAYSYPSNCTFIK